MSQTHLLGRIRRRAGSAALLLLPGAGCLAAQEPPPLRADHLDVLPTGVVVERIVSAADSAQSWALYVPNAYDPGRPWPVLFVMDPRGRALLPLERLVAPAERLGYVVMSSYNTASDFAGADPNEPALSAMLEDAQDLFTLDGRRLHLVGFSGTARAAWYMGMGLTGHLAGIIGVGAGMQPAMYEADLGPLSADHPGFSFYGLVGTRDFNYDEMGTLEARLDRFGIANHVSHFDGPHTWAPAEAMAEAVEWMEVRAMATGLRPVDRALADSLLEARMRRAAALESAGDTLAAYRAYEAAAEAWAGLGEPGDAARRAGSLRETAAVRNGLARADRLRERYWEVVNRFGDLLFDVLIGTREADADRLAEEIDVDAYLAEAARETDPVGADAATRILEHVFVNAWFYQPRLFVRQGRTEDALGMLDLAGRIFPERPQVCLGRAGVLAVAGRVQEAVDAVRCALAAGLPPDVLETEPTLAPLRNVPAFAALVRGG